MKDRRRYQYSPSPWFAECLFALVGIVLVLLVAPAVFADEYRPETRIQAPTAYVSGAPLPLSEISEFRLYCDGVQEATITPTGPVTDWQAAPRQFAAGDHSCFATAVDLAGDESAASNSVLFTVSADRPAPPALSIVAGGGAG